MQKIFSVSELTFEIKRLLEDNLYYVWVEGEISNLRSPVSGHLYFTLKDAYSQLRCVIFKGQSRLVKFKPMDGMHIICRGMVSVYPDRGEYQIIVDYLEPKGIGAQQIALQQLKERLSKEGLFDEKRKRQIPMLPHRVGIVTSPTGAAIRDILKVFQRRFANIGVLIYPVRVQGIESAREIANGIWELNRIDDIDVIIIGRGGGSQEDLQAFNEESVARAIYNSRVPVVSAVGHEIDWTIADMVSDLRAPTPSAAAEIVVKSKNELIEKIGGAVAILKSAISGMLNEKRAGLHRVEKAIIHPRQRLHDYMQRTDSLAERLLLAISNRFTLAKKEIQMLASGINALSPLNVLDRGYSITRKLPSLAILRDSRNVCIGDELSIVLSKGEVFCRVYAKDEV
ncbi:MAG: exodeoxyribonuclease VII large subunit [Deltaproteobacteria bacterium]|nr:exodeoxyribonuclease VII large subunit [Deltaproteobacteria bacterium]